MIENSILNNNNSFLINALSCMADGVIVVDVNGKIMFLNSAAEEITGWLSKEAKNENFNTIFPLINISTGEKIRSPIDNVIKLGKSVGLTKNSGLITKDNRKRYISANSSPIKDDCGNFIGVVVVFRDITRIRSIELELINKEIELRKAKEQAEAASKAKSEFLANMSHEIRTPLNGLVGMVDLTLLTDLNYEQKENLMTAKSCANSLLKVINDILDFSKLEAGKLVIENINFDIKNLIEEIIRANSSTAVAKEIELNYTFSSTIPQFLIGDPNRLRQVLNNLINNAIKFTEHGEISLKVKNIETIDEHVKLEFSVTDTGIGISEENINTIFESFSQVDSSSTRIVGGTGLGLAISKQLTEIMGGNLLVKSKFGQGSSFYFILKFPVGKEMKKVIKQPFKINKATKKLNILLVEDDKLNQQVIERMLKEREYFVDIANNGSEAIKMYENKKYDVILMDIQMPVMNGIEATKIIREKEIENHTPIIAITAYALKGDKERFLSKGMDDYIPKPIKMDKLFNVIESHTVSSKEESLKNFNIRFGENGEIEFFNDESRILNKEKPIIMKKLLYSIEELNKALQKKQLSSIERLANKIKSLSDEINIYELKDISFKVELSARRGDLNEAVYYAKKVSEEFEILKKSILDI
ncbi:response regulator [Clostridium scatologenes]|uniref:Circadian input-output histidine kinase CikA n=1 Tax=Clostridium scatologenes TaxID=1548 RepID=A0A0E3M5L9_CLOSL|nr:response regulator [Clostridium scatologenes]AKA68307.1 PAS/PAC sensor hybrid histidine kinase [Clostridium scatologenes]